MSDYIDSIQIGNGTEYDIRDALAIYQEQLLNLVYPVGSIYMTIRDVDPSTLFGGRWEEWGQGKTIVGVNGSDSDFNTAEESGGGKTKSFTPSGTVGGHALTVNEMPSHTHVQNAHNHTQNAHNHTQNAHRHSATDPDTDLFMETRSSATVYDDGFSTFASGHGYKYPYISDAAEFISAVNTAYTTATNKAATATNNSTTATNRNTGGGASHNHTFSGTASSINVMQPYITCFLWKRVE